MGMTIDDDIEMLEYIRQDFRRCRQGVALQDAINIMCKYQKIQEIINNAKDSDDAIRFNWLYEQIIEVIEDGKID